jgi:hypothetical protein
MTVPIPTVPPMPGLESLRGRLLIGISETVEGCGATG